MLVEGTVHILQGELPMRAPQGLSEVGRLDGTLPVIMYLAA